jgi:hypothetical protein
MAKKPEPKRILNAFEAFKAGVPLSDEMSKAVKKIESRIPAGRIDLSPREFNVYSRAIDAASVAKAPLSDDVSRATSRARP